MITIHEFSPTIYPIRLWVMVSPTYSDVIEKFHFAEHRDWYQSCTEDHFTDIYSIAKTFIVIDKETLNRGILICIFKTKYFNTNTICHEACHYADYVCDEVGLKSRSYLDGEAYAYLVGWAAECIESVKKKKKK